MKVLIVTQWFDPEPTFKGLAFANELAARGHDVEVVTGFPNYPDGVVYDGYKIRLLRREKHGNIRVNRVALYPNHGSSKMGRVLNYASFAFFSCLYGVFLSRKADVIYAYHPPLTVGLSASIVGFFRRTPVVYDIQDMWPDTLAATGMMNNRKVLGLVGKLCDWVYRRVAAIVVLSPGFEKLLIERGVPERKIHVIYNWCDEKNLTNAVVNQPPAQMQNKFNIVFAGTMGKAQALETVLLSAKVVSQKFSEVQFVFVGGGVEVDSLKQYSLDLNLSNVLFLPRMPMSEVGSVLGAADVLLVHLSKNPLFEITVPSKTQAYMAMGKPIIMGVSGDSAQLVREARCGYVVEPEDSDGLADAVMSAYQSSRDELQTLGMNAKSFYYSQLSLATGVGRFEKVFRTVSKK